MPSTMIKRVSFLFALMFSNSICFALSDGSNLPHEPDGSFYSLNLIYRDDMEEHREAFLKWISAGNLKDYNITRTIFTVSCRDADYIPKCANAGKVFYEDGNAYQLMHNGVKVLKDSYYGSWMTDLIFGLKGHHEPQEEKVFYEVLKYMPQKAVMIELGCYWAYYSLWFSKMVNEPTNYLIEPDPARLSIGKQNFALNGAEGTFFQSYVGSYADHTADYRQAMQTSIDSFLEVNHIEHVNILHSDIQGAEYQMLHSAISSIQANKIDYFFISTHTSHVHADCINFLKQHNYVIVAAYTPAESCSEDGLIVGKRGGLFGPERYE